MDELPVGYMRVEGTRRSPMPGATRIGPGDPNERVSVSVRLRRRPGAPQLPEAGSAARLSHEEFAASYGADPGDIAQVTTFADEHGLTVEETSIVRRTVTLAGTAAQLERAFAVDLGQYQAGETTYRGREGYVHMPAELAAIVEGVFGLDNRPQARPQFRLAAPAGTPMSTQTVQAMTPPQVANLYGFPAGFSAAGECIGLLEFGGGYQPSDITAWFGQLQIAPPTLADIGVQGGANSPGSSDDTEVILDIDVAASVGQGAKIAVYFAPWTEQGWVDVVSVAVHDATNDPSVLSISWGWPEFETAAGLTWTAAAMNAVSTTFQEAAALGVTVFAASGDQGSDCQIGDGNAHVIYPGCDPYVTSCGGTEIEDVSGTTFAEVLWNDNGASGGGVSVNFGIPSWQATVDVPASVNDGHHGRSIPDIAGNAHPDSGYVLVQDGGNIGPVGGTSAVAPLYAGLVALMNAHLNDRVGFLNSVLYQLAASGVFRDVTCCGTNAFSGAPGYPVGNGWDATTGFGSVRGAALLNELFGYLIAALIPSWH
jgi:kumamolisin